MSHFYLMKKMIILKKIQVTMKNFTSPFFNHLSLSLNRKKCGNESHEKETRYIYSSAASLFYIRIGNLNWCKVREINCLCCREIKKTLKSCFEKYLRAWGKHLALQLLWASAWQLVPHVISLMHLDGFFFLFLFWCRWLKWRCWGNLGFHLFVSGVNQV